jgi:hypothetical protein
MVSIPQGHGDLCDIPTSHVFPLGVMKFKGVAVSVPGDVPATLRYRYGDTYMIPRYVKLMSVGARMKGVGWSGCNCIGQSVGRWGTGRRCPHCSAASLWGHFKDPNVGCWRLQHFPRMCDMKFKGVAMSVPGDVPAMLRYRYGDTYMIPRWVLESRLSGRGAADRGCVEQGRGRRTYDVASPLWRHIRDPRVGLVVEACEELLGW